MKPRTPPPEWTWHDWLMMAGVVVIVALGLHFLFLAPPVDIDLPGENPRMDEMRTGGIWNTGLSSADQLEYAQLARQIWRGEGFTTKAIYPQAIVKVPHLPEPNLARPPLYPLLVAGAFFLFGCNDITPVLVSFFLYLIAAGLVYAIARRYCGRLIAVLVALGFASQPLVYVAGCSGLAGMLGAVLLTATIWLLLERRWLLASGILFGLAYLTRYHFIALTPFLAFYAGWSSEKHWRSAGLFLAGFFLAVSPWWIRNVYLVGNPLYSVISNEIMHFTETYPRQTLYGMTHVPSPVGFMLSHPAEMAGKMVSFFSEGLGATFIQFGWIGMTLVLVAFLSRRSKALAGLALLSLFVQLGMFGLSHIESRYLVPALPLLFVAAGAGLQAIWPERVKLPVAALLVVVLVAAHIVPILWYARPTAYEYLYFNIRWLYPREVEYIESETKPDDVLMSNIPVAVAWRCDRTAILAVSSPEGLEEIENLDGISLAAFSRSGAQRCLNEEEIVSSTPFRELFYLKERRPDQGVFYARIPPKEVWASSIPNLFAWDASAGSPVKLPALLEEGDRWGDEIWRLRGESGRVRDFEMTPSGKGAAILLESGGVIGIGDAPDVEEVMGYTDAVDLEFLSDGKSGAVLYRSGMVRVFGDATHLGYMTESQGVAKDLEFTGDGKGYLLMNAYGRIQHCGITPDGNTPDFGAPLVADMAVAPDGRGWYVLDVQGAIHKSDPSLPTLLGPYDASRPIAEELMVTPDGTVFMLTKEGSIERVHVKSVK